jgi:MED7 protein
MAEDSRIVSALPLPPPYYKLFAPKPVKAQDAVKEELAASDGAQVSALLSLLKALIKCLDALKAYCNLRALTATACFPHVIQNESGAAVNDSKYPLQPPPLPLPGTTYESFGTTCKVSVSSYPSAFTCKFFASILASREYYC